MQTAKERFRASTDAKKFAETIEAPWFQQAIEAAQQEFVESLPPPADEVTARANAWRIDGMRWFRTMLLSLTAVETTKTTELHAKSLFRRP